MSGGGVRSSAPLSTKPSADFLDFTTDSLTQPFEKLSVQQQSQQRPPSQQPQYQQPQRAQQAAAPSLEDEFGFITTKPQIQTVAQPKPAPISTTTPFTPAQPANTISNDEFDEFDFLAKSRHSTPPNSNIGTQINSLPATQTSAFPQQRTFSNQSIQPQPPFQQQPILTPFQPQQPNLSNVRPQQPILTPLQPQQPILTPLQPIYAQGTTGMVPTFYQFAPQAPQPGMNYPPNYGVYSQNAQYYNPVIPPTAPPK